MLFVLSKSFLSSKVTLDDDYNKLFLIPNLDLRSLKMIIEYKFQNKNWAVVVAQLAERSLPTPEIRGSNPNIGKNLSVNCIF